jgi:hypothetical protein
VSTHKKGRVCYLNPWELEEAKLGIKPNCRNHRHLSRTEAFEISGRPSFGTILGTLYREAKPIAKWVVAEFAPSSSLATTGKWVPVGYFVKITGRIEFTSNSRSELPLDQVRAKGLELAKKLGIPFIERKVSLHIR